MYSQIKLKRMNDSETKVFVKKHNYYAGVINSDTKTLHHSTRSSKNVFRLFGFEGLGINEEILLLKTYDKIVIKFNDEILSVSRLKWLRSGITSPYSDKKVDKQVILDLRKINLDEAVDTEEELTLFGPVS